MMLKHVLNTSAQQKHSFVIFRKKISFSINIVEVKESVTIKS